jgi:type IV conjugative transfer system coupling protein TraD
MSNKRKLTDYIRGSQITSHEMTMFGQGARISFLLGFATALLWFLYKFFSTVNPVQIYYWSVFKWIQVKYEISTAFSPSSGVDISFYSFTHGKWISTSALKFLSWHPAKIAIYKMHKAMEWLCSIESCIDIVLGFMVGMALSIGIFLYRGRKNNDRQFERGGVLLSSRKLARLLVRQGEASSFKIDRLPFVKGTETTHTMLVGTTGVGKTNCLYKLLPQIRAKKQKAIIVDLNGSFVSKYYREGKDIILNPFDKRCAPWSPWGDCLYTTHYDAFAKAMIPGGYHGGDKFWDQAAATLLSSILKKLKEKGKDKNSELCKMLFSSSISKLEAFLVGTPAATLVNPAGERMTSSIRATLNTQVSALQYLEDTDNPFSIREWMQKEDDSWLFLTSSPDQRETLNPLVSTWIEIALNGLMSLNIDYTRRVWFILDELPALQKVPSLKTALAEARKYGGCIVAGIQNFAQLQTIYGHAESQSLMNLFNTLFIFRTQDPDTCKYLANLLGEQELMEVQENKSYGANTIRDGVTLNQVHRKELLVMPTQISLLPNLKCYVKLAGNWPIAKLKMRLEKPKSICPEFILNNTMRPITPETVSKESSSKTKGNRLPKQSKRKSRVPIKSKEFKL